MTYKIITHKEIQARYPKIKSFGISEDSGIEIVESYSTQDPTGLYSIGGITTKTIFFTTLTHAGIKEQGEMHSYFLQTGECAIDTYLKHLFEFLDKEVQEDCELVWRKQPEEIIVDFNDCDQVAGKIYPKATIRGYGIYSRLLIRKLTNNK